MTPKNLWMLLDNNDHVIGVAFDSDGLDAFSRYHHIRRAVRYSRMTTDEQEVDHIGGKVLEQLDLFKDLGGSAA